MTAITKAEEELEEEEGEDAAEDGSSASAGGDASASGEADEHAYAEGSEAVAEGGFDDQGGFEIAAEVELVEDGQDDRTAHAGKRCRRRGARAFFSMWSAWMQK